MKKDFIEFNKHIAISNEKEKLAIYNDEEGNYTIYPLASLICKCEYVELDKQQLIVARFNQIVPQDMILPKKIIETQISKRKIKRLPVSGAFSSWISPGGMTSTSPGNRVRANA